jgi:superfamily II DNA helicase RecQ
MEQELTVYRLLEGRDVFAVMPTGIAYREVLE